MSVMLELFSSETSFKFPILSRAVCLLLSDYVTAPGRDDWREGCVSVADAADAAILRHFPSLRDARARAFSHENQTRAEPMDMEGKQHLMFSAGAGDYYFYACFFLAPIFSVHQNM